MKQLETIKLKNSPEYNEAWLQKQIAETPSILGLGDLNLRSKEKGSSCMTVGGFPLHKFAWPLFYGLLSRSSGPRNFD